MGDWLSFVACAGSHETRVDLCENADGWLVRADGQTTPLELDDSPAGIGAARVGNRLVEFCWHREGVRNRILVGARSFEVEVLPPPVHRARVIEARILPAVRRERGVVFAPIPGLVRAVLVKEGRLVTRGEPLLVLYAMKLGNEICSPCDGRITEIHASVGASVDRGARLISISPEGRSVRE